MNLIRHLDPRVKEFGERVNSAMFDAAIRSSLGGLGGCPNFNILDFEEDVRPYVLAYLECNGNSIAITYVAMCDKQNELR